MPRHAEQKGPLKFQGGWKRIVSAALIVLCLGGLLWYNSGLLWKETEEGRVLHVAFLATYLLQSALSILFCFLDADLPLPLRRALSWEKVFIVPITVFFSVDYMNGTRFMSFPFLRLLGNYLCCLLPILLLYALTRSAFWTVLLGSSAEVLFGMANYYVVQFRGQPILPWDLSAIWTAADVAGGYRFGMTRIMLISISGILYASLFCLRFCRIEKEELSRVHRWTERGVFGTLAALLCILLFPVNLLSHMNISVWAWNQKTSSEITGTFAGFVANVQFLMVEKPDGYSEKLVSELANELSALPEPEPLGTPEKLPTIVVVMNESLTDLQAVGDVKFAPDNLPFIHSLQQSGATLWGTAYSSVYGGNTCNSEYEFLTGNTTAFLPSGSKPFQQYVRTEQTALPSILDSYGYESTAIHPGNRTAWQRNTAYPNLGFDRFISVKDFDVKRVLKRNLTTDASDYEQVIYTYEHRDVQTPQFIFNVTIQNHGGFEDKDYPTTVQVEGAKGRFPQTEQYHSLIKESDEAFEGLIDYFSAQDDPVLVLLFGDHWPNLERNFLRQLLWADPNDLSFEDMMREYQVPFLLWANYPLEIEGNGEIGPISLNYLSGLLLRAAGLEGTPYTRFLEQMRQTLPVVTAVGIMDQDGTLYKNGDETPYDKLLNRYAVLQYNNSFDKDDKLQSLFAR